MRQLARLRLQQRAALDYEKESGGAVPSDLLTTICCAIEAASKAQFAATELHIQQQPLLGQCAAPNHMPSHASKLNIQTAAMIEFLILKSGPCDPSLNPS
jgi:hypothetical protein